MISEQEIKALCDELSKLTGFISEHGSPEQIASKNFQFACNICDALGWVLEDTSTEQFRSDAYLNLDDLNDTARYIETATGKNLADYQ